MHLKLTNVRFKTKRELLNVPTQELGTIKEIMTDCEVTWSSDKECLDTYIRTLAFECNELLFDFQFISEKEYNELPNTKAESNNPFCRDVADHSYLYYEMLDVSYHIPDTILCHIEDDHIFYSDMFGEEQLRMIIFDWAQFYLPVYITFNKPTIDFELIVEVLDNYCIMNADVLEDGYKQMIQKQVTLIKSNIK